MSEREFQYSAGDHHSTMIGYTVEAMFDFNAPRTICCQIFDREWRQITFAESTTIGVPPTKTFTVDLRKHGLYDYEAAQALRWWFHAQANFGE